jgi:flagellar hook-length control protein FliK
MPMLHLNIQPTTLDFSLNVNQSQTVQGLNNDSSESSFSSMLEQAQKASSTDGNQSKDIEKTQESKSVENEKSEEKPALENVNANEVKSEDLVIQNPIDERVRFVSQLEETQNLPLNSVEISLNPIESNIISEDLMAKLDSFIEKLDLTKVSGVKELKVKNPEITSKNIDKSELFSLIEDLKTAAKENSEEEALKEAFPFVDFEIQLVENKTSENQIVLENDLIAEIQLPEQNDGKISVIDMRTENVAEKIENPENSLITKEAAKKSDFVKTIEYDSNGNATISLSLKGENQFIENGQIVNQNTDFSSMLSKEIASSANDLVKTGSIILKDNNAGTINLILNPEELGSVKIKLEISDNQITGKILVASKEAYDAFNQNLNLLKNAFIESGFTAGGFDLAFTGSNQQGDFGQNGGQNQPSQSEINYKAVVYEQNVAEVSPESTTSTSTINLVA